MADWQQQRERGTALGMRTVLSVALWLGRRWALSLLQMVVFYFCCFSPQARKHSRDYLRRIGQPTGFAAVFRHFFSFASSALDRVFLLKNHTAVQVSIQQSELVLHTARQGGALLLVSHMGSFEAMRVPGTQTAHLPLVIVMRRQQNQQYTQLLESLGSSHPLPVIEADQDPTVLVLHIQAALADGKLVGLMADRARADEPTVAVDFLGGTARFPLAPWQMALLLGCPVLAAFAYPEHDSGHTVRYRAQFHLLRAGGTVPRKERPTAAAHAVQAYAEQLERWLHQAPYQWFNFYDFWEPPP